MSMGIGHKYWVHLILYKSGTLDECIEYMKKNPPKYKTHFYELRPLPDLKTRQCEKYEACLVEIEKTSIKSKEKK